MNTFKAGEIQDVVLTGSESIITGRARLVEMSSNGYGDVSLTLEMVPQALPDGSTLRFETRTIKPCVIGSKHFPRGL